MKKIVSLLAGFLVSASAFAFQCPDPSVSECFTDAGVVLPYFNTRSGWSTRFSVINPTDKKVTFTARLHDVDGYVKSVNHVVLTPYDMLSFGISPSTITGQSWWFSAPNDTSCKFHADSNVPIDEGYITISSELFTTFGPGGFCGNDYTVVDVSDFKYEYSIWTDNNTLLNDYREVPSIQPAITSAWTKNKGRSTDVVVNIKSFQPGQCQEAEYLIADRDGNVFKTFDTTEPSPNGWENVKFCHKVNVVHFGKPIFDSQVGIAAETAMPFLNNTAFFNDTSAGWVQWLIEGRSVSVRSEY